MRRGIYSIFFLQIFFLYFAREGKCTIIAKSDMTICENTVKDPVNVVYNKKCEKKLVVLAQVLSGQGETEKLYASVKRVYDQVEEEHARLYNPFIITVSMSPVYLVYPIYYIGTVNNKPFEVFTPKADRVCREDDVGCDYLKDDHNNYILHSQGFCCECRGGNYFENLGRQFTKTEHQYTRGRLDCDKYMSSVHCMRLDKLWYDIHEIGTFRFDFTIWVKAYDQVERHKGNRTVVDWVDGGEIELSPYKTGGVGKHGRIIAKYIGKMSSGVAYPRLEDYYFMIPNPSKMNYGMRTHPQLKNGYKDYLILPTRTVDFNSSVRCDVIGVTFTAFKYQSTVHSRGTSFGCHAKEGACLRNQIRDYFEEDQRRRERGEKTKYFPESFGRITGLKKRVGSTDRVVEFESRTTSSAQVYLEISADDLILIYNRASGIIVKAYANEFEAQSRNGMAVVIVQNTGLVTANFYVTLEACSDGVRAGHEQTASINPQTNHKFEIRLEAYEEGGGSFSCTASLYDARRSRVDSSVISINTTSTCVCILSCGCSCTDENYVCLNESDVVFDYKKPATHSDFIDSIASTVMAVFGAIGGFFKSIWNIGGFMFGALGHIQTIFMVVAFVILLCVAKMACSFVPAGAMATVVKKAVKTGIGEKPQVTQPPAPTIVVIQKDSESEADDERGMGTTMLSGKKGGKDRPTTKTTEFFFEFCFFFILPFLLVYKAAKWLSGYTIHPLYLWIKETLILLKNDKELSEKEYDTESDVEEYLKEEENSDTSDETDSVSESLSNCEADEAEFV